VLLVGTTTMVACQLARQSASDVQVAQPISDR
jgi:hypothetical protein